MKRNIILCSLAAVYFLSGYMITNHIQFFPVNKLHLFSFENSIPLIPWTVFIYITDYVYLLSVLFLLKDEKIDKFLYSFLLLATIHFVIFAFYPTVYPRSNWPLELNSISSYILHFVRLVDSPHNCFPSAHISVCFLGVFFIRRLKKELFAIFLIWAILISISTLTTKQHYFLDIIGGIFVAALSYSIVFVKKYEFYAKTAD
jgi:membrane-associated phospholipid phosphatase